MDTVTYPDTDVQAELEHWVFRKVDITAERALAEAFRVTAIPIAIAVDADGRIVQRIPNFVQPGPFAEALRAARTTGQRQ